MLALFVTSAATGVITTLVANRGAPQHGPVATSALSRRSGPRNGPRAQPAPSADAIPTGRLRAIPGVTSVTVIRANPVEMPNIPGENYDDWWPGVHLRAPELARISGLRQLPGRCPVAMVSDDLIAGGVIVHGEQALASRRVWPAAAIPGDVDQLPVLSVVVDTDGSAAAVERARTVLAAAFPQGRFAATVGDREGDFARSLVQWQQLADVVILASLPIAGCSLAVSVAGGLSERKRPFSLLRLTGVQLGVLRRVVLLESAVPLLVVAVVAIGAGFLAAHLFLRSQMHYPLRMPGAGYYLMVVAGLAVSLGIIASTLPLLRRITGPETARNE